jgi:DNA adenine methylase
VIKSPLRYPGGKSRAVEAISKLVPSFKEYREPFVGGGSVFVNLKQRLPDRKFWINDIYENLYLFWLKCHETPSELIELIKGYRVRFEDGKDLHKYLLANIDKFNDLEKAAAFFAINRITFSGTSESGGFSRSAFEKRFTISSIERVKHLAKILPITRITNFDYEEVITAPGDDVFIFLDPPYFSATKSSLYGKNGSLHKYFDHRRFSSIMRNVEHKWLITYDDSEYIKDMFSFAYIKAWDLTYGMRNVNKNSDQTGKELFISNYPINKIVPESLDLFAEYQY